MSVVKRNGEVQGYLWADDLADAAGFVPSRDAGAAAVNLGGAWVRQLREAKSRDVLPSQALAEIVAEGDSSIGEPGPTGEPVPFEQLRAVAGPPWWERASNTTPLRRG